MTRGPAPKADPQALGSKLYKLSDTLVVITTEFGRSPHRQDALDGLNHRPQGYVSVLMGGPVDEVAAGVAGSIATETATARRFTTRPSCARACSMHWGSTRSTRPCSGWAVCRAHRRTMPPRSRRCAARCWGWAGAVEPVEQSRSVLLE